MAEKKVVFVSVGTSALSTYMSKDMVTLNDETIRRYWAGDDAYQNLVDELRWQEQEGQTHEYDHQKKHVLQKLQRAIEQFKKAGPSLKAYKNLSAELASLKAMELAMASGIGGEQYPEFGKFTKDDRIYLIPTDTIEGQLCAEICKELITEFFDLSEKECEILSVTGLQVDSGTRLKDEGRNALSDTLKKIISDSDKSAERIWNITGGFKGLIPLFTILADIHKPMKLVYLFENSRELLIHDMIKIGTVQPDAMRSLNVASSIGGL